MRVVVPYDGSDLSRKALEYAADRYKGAEIVALYIVDFSEAGYDAPPQEAMAERWSDWHENAEENARELLEEAREIVDGDLRTETVTGRPARSIVEYAGKEDVDAIVMGSHGRDGLSRVLLGSVAESVVRRATVPVTVVR